MNIYIFGGNGMLGTYIYKYFKKTIKNIETNVIPITRNNFDVIDINYNKLEKILIDFNIKNNDVIINCIGKIPQRSNNNEINQYIKINTLLPVFLSSLSSKYLFNFIHITTDCVYNGSEGKYNELYENNEMNIYGLSKSLGELGDNSKTTIIRTSIIGEEKNNKKSLLEWVKSNKNKKIYGFTNHYWNGVTCLELSKIIYKIINENNYWLGVRHIFSPNIVSKYELCCLINKYYNLNINIIEKINEINIDKTLTTIYNTDNFNINNIEQQIIDLTKFRI